MFASLMKAAAIADDDADGRAELEHELDILPLGPRARHLRRLGAQRLAIDLLLGQKEAAAVALGEVQHVVDQHAEARNRYHDRLHIFVGGSAALARPADIESAPGRER